MLKGSALQAQSAKPERQCIQSRFYTSLKSASAARPFLTTIAVGRVDRIEYTSFASKLCTLFEHCAPSRTGRALVTSQQKMLLQLSRACCCLGIHFYICPFDPCAKGSQPILGCRRTGCFGTGIAFWTRLEACVGGKGRVLDIHEFHQACMTPPRGVLHCLTLTQGSRKANPNPP